MKRWVVRRPPLPTGFQLLDITVQADRCELVDGVAAFYQDVPDPRARNRWRPHELVRAFGVGQWRDVEPLASDGSPVQAPDPEAGVIRGAGDGCRQCGHRASLHQALRGVAGECQRFGCLCEGFR